MSSTLEIRGELVPNLAILAEAAPLLQAAGATLVRRAEKIMGVSKKLAPVRNKLGGTLRASGLVAPPEYSSTEVTVVMGYGGAASRYALSAHENPRTGKTGGFSPGLTSRSRKYRSWSEVGQWHFLVDPYHAERAGVLEALAESARADFARRLKNR